LKEEASMKTEKFIQDLAVYQTKMQQLEVFFLYLLIASFSIEYY